MGIKYINGAGGPCPLPPHTIAQHYLVFVKYYYYMLDKLGIAWWGYMGYKGKGNRCMGM